jgi:hypothetical protein
MQLLVPSPGTPGEGWGEGDFEIPSNSEFKIHPHPNPLPGYRAREKYNPGIIIDSPIAFEETFAP